MATRRNRGGGHGRVSRIVSRKFRNRLKARATGYNGSRMNTKTRVVPRRQAAANAAARQTAVKISQMEKSISKKSMKNVKKSFSATFKALKAERKAAAEEAKRLLREAEAEAERARRELVRLEQLRAQRARENETLQGLDILFGNVLFVREVAAAAEQRVQDAHQALMVAEAAEEEMNVNNNEFRL
jgi:hypothetical protein